MFGLVFAGFSGVFACLNFGVWCWFLLALSPARWFRSSLNLGRFALASIGPSVPMRWFRLHYLLACFGLGFCWSLGLCGGFVCLNFCVRLGLVCVRPSVLWCGWLP